MARLNTKYDQPLETVKIQLILQRESIISSPMFELKLSLFAYCIRTIDKAAVPHDETSAKGFL